VHDLVTVKWKGPDVYIGRPGPWGNPIPLRDKNDIAERISCLVRFANWLDRDADEIAAARREPPTLERIRAQLRGKTLGCYCAPKLCHGDVLARVAEGLSPQEALNAALDREGLGIGL
jgi:hypothetical protein